MNRYTLYMRLHLVGSLACFVIVAVLSELLSIPVIFKYIIRVILSLATIAGGMKLRQQIELYRGEEAQVNRATRWIIPSIGVLCLFATYAIAWLITFKFLMSTVFMFCLAIVVVDVDEGINKKEYSNEGRTTRYDTFIFLIELAAMCGLVYLFLYLSKL